MRLREIRPSWVEELCEYRLEFDVNSRYVPRGSGFSFPCGPDGDVLLGELTEPAKANYLACLSGEVHLGDKIVPVISKMVVKREWSYRHPAYGACQCGETVELRHFTNTCDRCGRDYNFDGFLLATRGCWGDETGELSCDCL